MMRPPKLIRELAFDLLWTSGHLLQNTGETLNNLAWWIDPTPTPDDDECSDHIHEYACIHCPDPAAEHLASMEDKPAPNLLENPAFEMTLQDIPAGRSLTRDGVTYFGPVVEDTSTREVRDPGGNRLAEITTTRTLKPEYDDQRTISVGGAGDGQRPLSERPVQGVPGPTGTIISGLDGMWDAATYGLGEVQDAKEIHTRFSPGSPATES